MSKGDAGHTDKLHRYTVEVIAPRQRSHETDCSYRVTDTRTDSRIATCWQRSNADLIVDALNTVSAEGTGNEQVAKVLRDYASIVRTCHSSELERFTYLPEIEDALKAVTSAAVSPERTPASSGDATAAMTAEIERLAPLAPLGKLSNEPLNTAASRTPAEANGGVSDQGCPREVRAAASAVPFNQEALDRASWEIQRHFGREGSIFGIKACEEIARIALVAYGIPSSEVTREPGMAPGAELLVETDRNASYWLNHGRATSDRDKAVLMVENAMNSWRNAAYAMAARAIQEAEKSAQSATVTFTAHECRAVTRNMLFSATGWTCTTCGATSVSPTCAYPSR